MGTKYFTLLTQVGEVKLAASISAGKPLQIALMGVGDGGGSLPAPDPSQTRLINEKRRGVINSLTIDPDNLNQMIAEQVIPENEGGFWLREIGLYDIDGDLIAVSNCPETYKPELKEGSGRVQTVRMILIVNSTDAVTLTFDPTVALATRRYADMLLANHALATNPHKQYAPIESPTFTGNPVAPTPPLFDADTSIATTAFVQRALGNMKSAFGVRENKVLTSDAFGCFIESQVADITITLPDARLCPGGVIEFNNISNGAVIISGAGLDILGPNNPSGSKTLKIQSGANVKFLSTGPQWRAIGGAGVAGAGLNGYQVLPSGIIIQWGIGRTLAAGVINQSFPIVYPNNFFSVVITENNSVGWNYTGVTVYGQSNSTREMLKGYGAFVRNGGSVEFSSDISYQFIAIGD
ncbi:phage tail protein [Dickeya fangzhongdai]|uniref:Phage tail protein n=1 Tax=Dickeya fangzhongdai TaxID=1778540 RepID=A0A2K8QS48_9GAMM|nr:phage tail protein [Dickeya fangzhongdai]ATZ96297.1 phage tail protein [Dickeya fangzhongdai]QOH49741.1 phage tail protein [Dickeya fangzhongdai]QOH54045.1 phage tail protein [Dickeya fangzhongdai]WES90025.1 phage tail protein [Dickeya fangzhongdai]WOX98743.1 phage tail protein [Dickeya fangzhongdai]